LFAAVVVMVLPTLQGKLGARLPDLVSRTNDTRQLIPSDDTLVLLNLAYILVSAAVNLMVHWAELGGNSVVTGTVGDSYVDGFFTLGVAAILTTFIPLWLERAQIPGKAG